MTEEDVIVYQCKRCVMCGDTAVIDLPTAGFEAWVGGAHVQHAFPGMSADIRELLISGTHSACWDEMWGDTEE